MKLGKEEIQKIVLGVLLLFGVLYSYFDLLLFPLKKYEATARRSVEALGPQIANCKAQIEKTKKMEQEKLTASLPIRQAFAMIPEGSPVAWFPVRMAEFFKKQGIERVTSRINGESVDRELPVFRRIVWGVDIPKVEFVNFGQSIAALENEEPLLEISAMQVDSSRDDVESQHVLLTVTNLVKQ